MFQLLVQTAEPRKRDVSWPSYSLHMHAHIPTKTQILPWDWVSKYALFQGYLKINIKKNSELRKHREIKLYTQVSPAVS